MHCEASSVTLHVNFKRSGCLVWIDSDVQFKSMPFQTRAFVECSVGLC